MNAKKILAMAMTLIMAVALFAVPAFAADSNYTVVTGTSTTFKKALVMDQNANVPTIDFEFSIAPGSAVAYTAGSKMAVYAGDDDAVSGVPVIKDASGTGTAAAPGKASYAPGDATTTSDSCVTLDSGEKAAIKTMTVDFSGVTFAEPGIYRWIITETSAGQQGITYDTQAGTPGQKTRVLDVYVTDSGSGLAVSSYVLHENVGDVAASADYGSGDVNAAGAALSDKSEGFVNEYETFDIDLSKVVSSNQASKDKYFAFEVAITNAGANVDLDVVIAEDAKDPLKSVATQYAAATMAAANTADDDNGVTGQQWQTNASGAVTKTVYLKHGQSIQIKGLASGAKYTITETPEDYKPSTVKTPEGGTAVNGTTAVVSETAGMAADHDIDYTNTRSGNVPTGVLVSAIPGAALLGIGGFAIFASSRKKKEEEEE